jgi:hypothetical protein
VRDAGSVKAGTGGRRDVEGVRVLPTAVRPPRAPDVFLESGAPAGVADRIAVFGLGTGVAYGGLAQGAFYAHQSQTAVLAVLVAAGVQLLVRRRVDRYVLTCVAAWVLFAGWVLARAWGDGRVADGLPAAVLAVALGAAAWSTARLPSAAQRVLHMVILAAAVVVAASGWVGVVLHLPPLALPSYAMWRASATLTYANSAAAFLVVTLLVAVAVLPARRLSSRVVVAVLLLGLLATMSRAGLLALGAGAAVYVGVLRGIRRDRAWRELRGWWPVAPAAALGFAGLLPGVPEHAAPAPGAAVAGLAAGLVVLVAARGDGRVALAMRRIRPAVAVAGAVLVAGTVLVVGVGVWAAWSTAGRAVDEITTTRFTASSPERADLTRVTLAQIAEAPVTGRGPGRLDLDYVDHRGVAVRARYAHDEYLQTTAETGIVGLVLVLGGAAALAVGAARRLRRAPGRAAGALAVLAAVAVHGAFDFLWHIAVLPLLLVLSVVSLLPSSEHP